MSDQIDQAYVQIGDKRLRLSSNHKHYLNEETKDITFVVKGVRIPAHKVILSASSDVFDKMVYNRADLKTEEFKDLLNLKETSPEVFKYILKVIYFDEFDVKDLNNDYLFAIDVYKLAHRLNIQLIMALVIEELTKMVSIDNFMALQDFGTTFKLEKLTETIKEFIVKNEDQIIDKLEQLIKSDQFENFDKYIDILNLKQKHLIQIIAKITGDEQDVGQWHKYRSLIKLDSCSFRDLINLRNTRLFDQLDLDRIAEQRFTDIENKWNQSDIKCKELTQQLKDKLEQTIRLTNDFNEMNQMFQELMAHYKETKETFMPFVEGTGGRVNQFVFTKSNCYFGKIHKKFSFKY